MHLTSAKPIYTHMFMGHSLSPNETIQEFTNSAKCAKGQILVNC
jgi:hypothetical protein